MPRTSVAGTDEPAITPSVPPTPTAPKSRLPCSDVNRSVTNPQNTAVLKSAKTLTHT
jgi:hypothetical protein